MSKITAVVLLVVYGLILFVLSYILNKKDKSFKSFMVANRKVGVLVASFSIAATWIWAPALFVSAQKAFQQGLVGFGWFFIPNVLCLIFFGIASSKIRKKFPEGFTLPEVMRTKYGDKVHSLYLTQFSILQLCSFAVQLLAGASIIGWITGIPFFTLTLLLSAIALSYSVVAGLRASVITDFIQMSFILLVAIIAVPWVIHNAGGFSRVVDGFGGLSGKADKFFSKEGIEIMLTFGLINTIGLIAGPFGDQMFWQRTFAIDAKKIKKSFLFGGIIFGIVPLLFAALGFIGASDNIQGIDPQLINIVVIQKYLPAGIVPLVVILIISGLVSTLDSVLCAVSSLVSIDFGNRIKGSPFTGLKIPRISMVAFTIIAVAIANINGLKILHLFLFYGTLRAATLIPTLITIFGKPLYNKAVFVGLLLSLVIGLPVFVIGKLIGSWQIALAGNLMTVSISGLVAYFWSKKYRAPLSK